MIRQIQHRLLHTTFIIYECGFVLDRENSSFIALCILLLSTRVNDCSVDRARESVITVWRAICEFDALASFER